MKRGKECRRGHDNWSWRTRAYACVTCRNENQNRHRRAAPHLNLHNNAQQRARNAGLPFALTLDDVKQLLEAGWICCYCESPVGSFPDRTRPLSATLDRLVSEDGYTVANTVIACHKCNAEKGEHTPATLRAWANQIETIINRKNPTKVLH